MHVRRALYNNYGTTTNERTHHEAGRGGDGVHVRRAAALGEGDPGEEEALVRRRGLDGEHDLVCASVGACARTRVCAWV